MIIIADYTLTLKVNMNESIYIVNSTERNQKCPVCKGILNYRDSRKRIMREEGGEVKWLLIKRYCCVECRRYHTELPDCVTPYKQYSTEIISGVLDGIVTAEDQDDEDYPCLQTMIRWMKWFYTNMAHIECCMKNLFLKDSVYLEDREINQTTMLFYFRKLHKNWLEIVQKIIYNNGDSLLRIYG